MSLKTEGDISPELKVAARDLHYTLIEQYGLKDDPVSNHAIREGLHQLMRLAATASESLLALTNDALAACQAQAAGKIRELEARLRAARYDDEIDDGDMIDDEQDGHCDCGALHSEGTEESDSGQCSACGGAI